MDKATLYKYFSHEATDDVRRQVREWVESSPENMQEYMAERAFYDSVTLLADPKLPAVRRFSFKRMLTAASKIAAVAVVTLLLSYVVRTYLFPPQIPMQELYVPVGKQLNLTLADGTNVWLNSGTRLKYPAIFSGKERRVEIDGEGYFKVQKDADCPFRVQTDGGVVEVLGTTFNVEAYSSEHNFRTSLLEGSVKITDNHNGEYQLSPDQMAEMQADGSMKISAIPDYDAFRWTEGIISLKNDSFESIMKKFEKYYGVTIKIECDNFAGVSYSGKFYHSDGLQYALKVLQRDIDFTYVSEQENHIIYIK